MTTVVVRHRVEDFKTWLEGHQERTSLFGEVGASFKTFQDMDDPNSVILVIETPDVEKLGAMMNDPNNQHLKDKHTVLNPIIMSMEIKL